jgi:hypothetical protein
VPDADLNNRPPEESRDARRKRLSCPRRSRRPAAEARGGRGRPARTARFALSTARARKRPYPSRRPRTSAPARHPARAGTRGRARGPRPPVHEDVGGRRLPTAAEVPRDRLLRARARHARVVEAEPRGRRRRPQERVIVAEPDVPRVHQHAVQIIGNRPPVREKTSEVVDFLVPIQVEVVFEGPKMELQHRGKLKKIDAYFPCSAVLYWISPSSRSSSTIRSN